MQRFKKFWSAMTKSPEGNSIKRKEIKRKELSWFGWQGCKMPHWVREALEKSDLVIDRDAAPARWIFEISGKVFRYRVVVEAYVPPEGGRPSLGEACYRKRLRSKGQRSAPQRRLAYKTKAGKRVWLYATERDEFEVDGTWTCTGRRSFTNGMGSGRIRDALPQWVWHVLAESPRVEEGTGRVYLINGKHHQYLYSMFVTDDGDVYREAYRRQKR